MRSGRDKVGGTVGKRVAGRVRSGAPRRPIPWLAHLGTAMAIGAAAGVVGIAFRGSLTLAERGRESLVSMCREESGWWLLVPPVVAAGLAGVAVWLVQRFAPEASGSGIPHLKAVLRRRTDMRPWRILPVKFFSGLFGIAAGLALGREGPTAHMGGSIGNLTGQLFGFPKPVLRSLGAVGAAAGLAAAFNAPFAATLFVVEELRKTGSRTPVMALVACVVADILTRVAFGPAYIYPTSNAMDMSFRLLPWAVFLGVAGGLLGRSFNLCVLHLVAWLSEVSRRFPFLVGGAAGLFAGYLAIDLPTATGDGEVAVHRALAGQIGLGAAGLLLVFRFILTSLSFASGAAGGLFAPLLAMGALLGCCCMESVMPHWPGHPIPVSIGVVLSMSAVLVGSLQSPLTGVMLLLELTGDFGLLLPLLVSSIVALAVAKLCGGQPVYDALMEQKFSSQGTD